MRKNESCETSIVMPRSLCLCQRIGPGQTLGIDRNRQYPQVIESYSPVSVNVAQSQPGETPYSIETASLG